MELKIVKSFVEELIAEDENVKSELRLSDPRFRDTVLYYKDLVQLHGMKVFDIIERRNNQNPVYSKDFKKRVIRSVKKNKMTNYESALVHILPSPTIVDRWIRQEERDRKKRKLS